ncbi:MAG: tRNA (adenosine(37)-N6)-dimethylallyltransferase MiaA, partial [Deltaproteobacteria bacterium]|nr:tRNA (adenosine(37)-N6)-dimethylallyltransferase MiaA [Deltaproteobacteria bacterium]
MQRIIVIFGPTASSKSRIAIETAKKFNGEVLNADSRQFFKYMQIGTASPSDTEKSEIPHHLYN